MSKYCPNCGTKTNEDENFCKNCGYNLLRMNEKEERTNKAQEDVVKINDDKNKVIFFSCIFALAVAIVWIIILCLFTITPDLYNVSAEKAESILISKGFIVRKEYEYCSDGILNGKDAVEPDKIIDCKPKVVKKGGTVDLVVSKGKLTVEAEDSIVHYRWPIKSFKFYGPQKREDNIRISGTITASEYMKIKGYGTAVIEGSEKEIPITINLYKGERKDYLELLFNDLNIAIKEENKIKFEEEIVLNSEDSCNVYVSIPCEEYKNLPKEVTVYIEYQNSNGVNDKRELKFNIEWEKFKK